MQLRFLLPLFLSFRFLSLLLLRPGGYIRDYSDFNWYLGIAALSDYGLYPFLDFWLEWPPPIPWLMVGAYRLALLFPAWEDHRFWFITILGSVFVIFEIGNFILMRRIAYQMSADDATVNRVLWLYAGLFPLVYTMLGFFDGVALFFMLLACSLMLQQAHRRAAMALGLGFAVKIIPIIVLPIALKSVWSRFGKAYTAVAWGWLQIIGICVAVIFVMFLPFLWYGPQWVAAFFRAVFDRSSWETVWAVAEGFYGFGAVAGDRLNPNESVFTIHEATLPWLWINLGFMAIFGLMFVSRIDMAFPRRVIGFAGLIVAVFMLYSKGYSPQFIVYLLPFIILLLPDVVGLGYALVLTGLNVLEQPLYFVIFDPLQGASEPWLLSGIVIARFVVLIALAIEFGLIVWNIERPFWQRSLRGLLVAATVIGLIVLIPKGWQSYQRVQLARNPHQPLITFLQSQSQASDTLLLTDQDLYRHLYPFLSEQFTLKLAGGDQDFVGAPTTEILLQSETQIWFLPSGRSANAVDETVDTLGQTLVVYPFDDSGTLRFVDLSGDGQIPAPLAQTESGIGLMNYDIVLEEKAIQLTLYWQTSQNQTSDYTVFTQLLDSSGQLITSHDGPPNAGSQTTSSWAVNQIVIDHHTLPLPDTVPVGTYTLYVGMYDDAIQRLPFLALDQQPFPNHAVRLTILELP
ncbi:MAG: glycosyltransferase family 87 protein [Chloroflexota bacterium]